jgi:hypothetical protein
VTGKIISVLLSHLVVSLSSFSFLPYSLPILATLLSPVSKVTAEIVRF